LSLCASLANLFILPFLGSLNAMEPEMSYLMDSVYEMDAPQVADFYNHSVNESIFGRSTELSTNLLVVVTNLLL